MGKDHRYSGPLDQLTNVRALSNISWLELLFLACSRAAFLVLASHLSNARLISKVITF
jgi:hypothetical protein